MKSVKLNSMTQPDRKMEKKTIQQLLEMPKEELKEYLLSIPVEERGPINKELLKAIYDQALQKVLNNVDR